MFDKVVCLVVDKRIADWPQTREECLKRDLPVEPFFCGNGKDLTLGMYNHIDIIPPERPRTSYPAFRDKPNSYNAFLCFKKIIQGAVDHNKVVAEMEAVVNKPLVPLKKIENLLLFEDDLLFKDNYAHILSSAKQQLTGHKPFDILYLGANHKFAKTERISPNLLKVDGSGCFHAVCLRDTVFQAILDLEIINPIDGEVARLLHKRFNCLSINPSIVGQKSGFSYCENRNVDYSDLII